MREDDLFGFAPPKTATDFVARGALRSERAGLARGGRHTVAHHDFLTTATPPTRFTSHPLEEMPRRTPIRLQLGQPLEVRLGEEWDSFGPTHVVRLPGPIPRHAGLGTLGSVDPRHLPTVDSHGLQAVARQMLRAR